MLESTTKNMNNRIFFIYARKFDYEPYLRLKIIKRLLIIITAFAALFDSLINILSLSIFDSTLKPRVNQWCNIIYFKYSRKLFLKNNDFK